MPEKLRDKLPIISPPLYSHEVETNNKAIEYNRLKKGDPRRQTLHSEWEDMIAARDVE